MERFQAIYARQSIDKKDSLSIDGQIELCRIEAGAAPAEVYQDRGYSGKNVKRPDFTRLMKDIAEGHVSKVICYRLDRISRSIADFGYIWEVMSKHGVEFVSVNEKFDTSTPVGRAMLYIIMVFAQLERETIAERIKDNYYQRVRRGAWPGGRAPYGFEIKKEPGKGSSLAPTPKIDAVIKMFETYSVPGASLGSVCRWLNGQAIARTTKPTWPTISLNRLLRNPAYVRADATIYAYYKAKGLIMANDIEDFDGKKGVIIIGQRTDPRNSYSADDPPLLAVSNHEGIIPADLFLLCQNKLDRNKQLKSTGTGKHTWLSGLLKCGECGYSLRAQKKAGKPRAYLVCTGRFLIRDCSHTHSEKIEDVESFVERAMQERIVSIALSGTSQRADEAMLKSELSVIEDKIGKLIAALAEASAVTIQYVNQELEQLDAQRQEKLLKLSGSSVRDLFGAEAVHGLQLSELDFDSKKAIAQLLIERVSCTTDSIDITWKQ